MAEEQTQPGWKRALRRIVPESLRRDRQIILRLGPQAGAIYARLRLLDSLGVRPHDSHGVGPKARSLIFVCFGNIMRSPMAEALFRKEAEGAQLAGIRATSAGLHAIPGHEAHPWALTASAEMGLPLTDHRARLLTPKMVAEADAILAMDFQNLAELLALYPEARQKILLVSAYAESALGGREIADPYLGNLDSTRACYARLQTCIHALTRELITSR
jgi:protein-tyrosine phosphatase